MKMKIITKEITINELMTIETETYFDEDEMIKAVADIEKGVLAVNAPLHSDLEELLLSEGSSQKSLYGFNIYSDGTIEYDSLINPPRNREAGYPRAGRDVADPKAREAIKEIVEKWIH